MYRFHTLQFYILSTSKNTRYACSSASITVSVYSTGVLILLAGQVLSLFDADLEVIMHNVLCSHHKNKMCKVQYYVCPESHVKNVVYILKWL